MPWLVVLGESSWSYTYGREWEDGPWNPPGDAPRDSEDNPKTGRWNYRSATFRAADSPFKVDEEVAAAARESGYSWLYVEDEPIRVTHEQAHGEFTPEDAKAQSVVGVQVAVDKAEVDAEPGDDKPEVVEEPTDVEAFEQLLHGCPLCTEKFPTSARLDRHVEFNHPQAHGQDMHKIVEAQKRIQREREELRRLEDADGPIRPEDKEALERAGVKQPPTAG